MAPTRILVVANRTASTQRLLDEVGRRARDGASFTLIIPPETGRGAADDWSSDDALELLGRAAGGPVAHRDCGSDALAAAHEVVDAGECDEIIVSAHEPHLARLVHHDLRHRLEHLGLPVMVIQPEPDVPLPGHVTDAMPDDWYSPHAIPGGGGAGNF